MRPILKAVVFRRAQYHPIASARIDAIYAAGGSCPVGIYRAKRLLSDFIRAEESRFGGAMKRIHLPGFGNAGANAIDLVTGASGSFPVAGGVTHELGVIKGDGSSGYFSAGVTAPALGVTTSSLSIFFLSTQADSRTDTRQIASVFDSASQEFQLASSSSTQLRFDAFNNNPTTGGRNDVNLIRADHTGVIVASRAGGKWLLGRRSSTGYSLLLDRTGADVGAVPVNDVTFLAQRFSGTAITSHNNGRSGAYGIGLGLSATEIEQFSANIKTLWEGLFQLSLP